MARREIKLRFVLNEHEIEAGRRIFNRLSDIGKKPGEFHRSNFIEKMRRLLTEAERVAHEKDEDLRRTYEAQLERA